MIDTDVIGVSVDVSYGCSGVGGIYMCIFVEAGGLEFAVRVVGAHIIVISCICCIDNILAIVSVTSRFKGGSCRC